MKSIFSKVSHKNLKTVFAIQPPLTQRVCSLLECESMSGHGGQRSGAGRPPADPTKGMNPAQKQAYLELEEKKRKRALEDAEDAERIKRLQEDAAAEAARKAEEERLVRNCKDLAGFDLHEQSS